MFQTPVLSDPSVARMPLDVRVSSKYFSPKSSAVNLKLLRAGKPRPKPYRSPLLWSVRSASARAANPR